MNYLAVLPLPSPAFTYQPKEREREAEQPVTSKVTYQPKGWDGRSRISSQRRTLGCSGNQKWGNGVSCCPPAYFPCL